MVAVAFSAVLFSPVCGAGALGDVGNTGDAGTTGDEGRVDNEGGAGTGGAEFACDCATTDP